MVLKRKGAPPVEKNKDKDAAAAQPQADAESEDPNKVYCLCRKPYQAGVFMIACDSCNEWFHGECVGITEQEAEEHEEYVCPGCIDRGVPQPTKRKKAKPKSAPSKSRKRKDDDDEDDDGGGGDSEDGGGGDDDGSGATGGGSAGDAGGGGGGGDAGGHGDGTGGGGQYGDGSTGGTPQSAPQMSSASMQSRGSRRGKGLRIRRSNRERKFQAIESVKGGDNSDDSDWDAPLPSATANSTATAINKSKIIDIKPQTPLSSATTASTRLKVSSSLSGVLKSEELGRAIERAVFDTVTSPIICHTQSSSALPFTYSCAHSHQLSPYHARHASLCAIPILAC